MKLANILFIYFDKYFRLRHVATERAIYFTEETFLLLRKLSSFQIINLYRE